MVGLVRTEFLAFVCCEREKEACARYNGEVGKKVSEEGDGERWPWRTNSEVSCLCKNVEMAETGIKTEPKSEAGADSGEVQDTNVEIALKITKSGVNINIKANKQQISIPVMVKSGDAAAGSAKDQVSANWSLINSTHTQSQLSIALSHVSPPKRSFRDVFTSWFRSREPIQTSTFIEASDLMCPTLKCESSFSTYRELKGHLNYSHSNDIMPLPFIRQLKFILNQRSVRKIVKFVNVLLLVEVLWFAGRKQCVVCVGGIGDSEKLSKGLQFRVNHCRKWQRVILYPFNESIDKGYKVKNRGERLLTIHFANK